MDDLVRHLFHDSATGQETVKSFYAGHYYGNLGLPCEFASCVWRAALSANRTVSRAARYLAAALAVGIGIARVNDGLRSSTTSTRATPANNLPRQKIGFPALVIRVYREVDKDRVLAVAAGVAFFGLLALFPAVTAFVSLYGLLVPLADIANHLSAAGSLLPEAANKIVADQVTKLTATDPAALSVASVFDIAVSIWSANSAMKAMMDALNVAYGVVDRRGIIRFNLMNLIITLGAVFVLICLLLTLATVPIVLDRFWLGWAAESLLSHGRW